MSAVGVVHGDVFSQLPAVLRGVTSLAEGSDRIFAREAIAAGYELSCILPFPQARFEQDFVAGNSSPEMSPSVVEFRSLLQQAQQGPGLTIFELDGERYPPSREYQPASRTVLNQSDIILAIWDGSRELVSGGTFESIRDAISIRVPVLWLDPARPDEWRLLRTAAQLDDLPAAALAGELADVVRELLKPPADSSRLLDYLQGPGIAGSWPIWKWFRKAMGYVRAGQTSSPEEIPVPAPAEVSPSAKLLQEWRASQIDPHFKIADERAGRFGDRYRSYFLLCHGLAVVAVLLALLPVVFASSWRLETDVGKVALTLCSAAELLVLAFIAWLVRNGNKRQLHERWLECRLIAELLRQQRILLPFGVWRSLTPGPIHLQTYESTEGTWMYWYVRALAREAGMPPTRVDAGYFPACAKELRLLVAEQLEFHQRSSARDERIHHRLHGFGVALFVITTLLIAFHLWELLDHSGWFSASAVEQPSAGEAGGYLLAALCAFLPAWGAACAAVNNQGEFVRVAKRSKAMAERFEQILHSTSHWIRVTELPPSSTILTVSMDVSQMMVDEVLDWRVVFLDRVLVTPS